MVHGDSNNYLAEKAGHISYGSISRTTVSSSFSGYHKKAISAARRMFCLLVLFDLILAFMLWVIYTKLITEENVWKAFIMQLENFTYEHSLFDTVMMAVVRFTVLLLAYALFRINHRWVIALTTLLTCVFLVSKCFMFQFTVNGKSENSVSYILLIVGFVLAWVETWFLDFKVLSEEKEDRQNQRYAGSDERRQLPSGSGDTSIAPDEILYFTPEGSDDENKGGDGFRSAVPTRENSLQECGYTSVVDAAWDYLWELLLQTDNRWKVETGHDTVEGSVHSRYFKKYGKFFRLQGVIDMSPESLFREMVDGLNNSPEWNPTVLECRTLESVDDCREISYNVTAEAAGGLVSSRDFINVRRWGQREGVYMSAGCSINYPTFATSEKHVRGENGPGGWVFKTVIGNPQQCLFIWFINTDLKGWLPKATVDKVLAGVMMEYLQFLRKHIEDVKLKKDNF